MAKLSETFSYNNKSDKPKLSESFSYNTGGISTAPSLSIPTIEQQTPKMSQTLSYNNTQTESTKPKLSEYFSYDIDVPHNEPKDFKVVGVNLKPVKEEGKLDILGGIKNLFTQNVPSLPSVGQTTSSYLMDKAKRENDTEKHQQDLRNQELAAFDAQDKSNVVYTGKNGNNITRDKISLWLQPDYKLSDDEKKQAKEYYHSAMEEIRKDGMQHMFDGGSDIENKDEVLKQLEELSYKISSAKQFGYGFLQALPGVKTAQKATANFADETFGNNEATTHLENVESGSEGKAKSVGKAASKMTQYIALNQSGLLNPVTSKLTNAFTKFLGNKIGGHVANVLSDEVADVLLDTIPEMAENIRDGMSAKEVRNEVFKNLGINLAYNMGGEAIPSVVAWFKNRGKNITEEMAEEIIKNANEIADTVAKEVSSEAADATKIANREVAKSVAKNVEIPKVADEVATVAKNTEVPTVKEAVESVAKNTEIPTVYKDYEIVTVHRKGGKEAYVPKGVDNNGILYTIHKAVKTKEEAQQIIEDYQKNLVMAEDIGLNKNTDELFEQAEKSVPTLNENSVIEAKGYAEPTGNTLEQGYRERGYAQHVVGEETPMKVEGLSKEVTDSFAEDKRFYEQLKNADTKALADEIYQSGDTAIKIGDKVYEGSVENKFRELLKERNPASLPLGHQLAKDYQKAGNHQMAVNIIDDMSEALTKSGQFSQAAIINMVKNDPLTALEYAKKQIDSINRMGAKEFGDKWKNFALTEDEIKAFGNIADGDEEAIKQLFDDIGERLGKEYPSTFLEKILEARKIAMLFNVRTNVRNFGANVPMLPMRWMSDRVEALGQNIAHLIDPNFKVTQSLTGSGINGRKLAKEVFNSDRVKVLLDNDVNKYEVPELKNTLFKKKQMYKGTAVEKWINKVTNGGIEKVNEKLFGKKGVESLAETVRNTTYKALELGDEPFVKENFIERLGSYIKAQGYKTIEEVPEEAIQTAWEEAMKATYKDNSWAVKMLRGIKGGFESVPVIGKPISQAAIPFLQAPGNIAARMVDYSPIRGTKGIYDIISGAAKGNQETVKRGIEEFSKGVTGTGLVLLGMALRKEGIITGDYSKDKDEKNFQKQNGFRPWALKVGDKYFTYDWSQPAAQNLMLGTLIAEAIENSDEADNKMLQALGVAYEGGKAAINSWFDASPLQGLANLMKGNSYTGDTDYAQNLINTGAGDFAGAFVPATVNAVAKTMDKTQRNAYDPSSKWNTFVNQQIAKIPALSQTLPAKYDTWGNRVDYAQSTGEAFAQRFFVPGDSATAKNDKVDNEIQRLYTATNDNSVFPQTAPNKVGEKTLNNTQVSNYQQDMGKRSRLLVEALMKTDGYKNLSDDSKAEVLKNLYGMSKTVTERNLFKKEVNENSSYKKAIDAYDSEGGKNVSAVINYYLDKAQLNNFKKEAAALRPDGSPNTMDKEELAVYLYEIGYDLEDINEWLVKNGAKNGYTQTELNKLLREAQGW